MKEISGFDLWRLSSGETSCGVLLERHQKAFSLRGLHMVGEKVFLLTHVLFGPHLESEDKVSATLIFLAAVIWKRVGKLDLLVYLGGSIWK